MARSHHARGRTLTRSFSPPPIGDAQYVQGFFQSALARLPNANESSYWNDILRAAYAHAQSSMVLSTRELGKTLFESAEYAARGRNNHDYVFDLYWAYLLRAPDAGGWAYWESLVPSLGREAVRRAFDECDEFTAAVATITANGAPTSAVSSLLTQRVEGSNQPGSGLLSRDAAWSLPLVSLPGRAGLDLGLGLSYSSVVWTRSGPYIYFDEDNGWPSPGFRLGFPTVQEQFFNAQAGQNAYLMITSDGARVELRQVGATNIYEAVDSSHLQLTDNGGSLLVRATDGTQMSYSKLNNEWRCGQVKDANGNFFTVNHDWLGHITSIVDTLNRTITFNYDGNANPTSITQTWNGQTHQWVTFGWTTATVQPGFTGVVGAASGVQIPALNRVGLADGSYYKFSYTLANTGQVSRLTRYASDSNPVTDSHPLAYTNFNYLAPDDSTRLTATKAWAENWAGINGVPSEVLTQYGLEGATHVLTAPDGTVFKEFYGSGWQRNLVTRTEVWAGGLQKWTTTDWTQDNTSVAYLLNPRMTESNVYDAASNRKRTTIQYAAITPPGGATCYLPSEVYEYQADALSVYRRTHIDYLTDSAYLSQRLIGLPSGVTLYNASNVAQSITLYRYDWASHLEAMPGGVNPVQHDASYNTAFTTRGNLVSLQRLSTDPNDPPNTNTEFKWGFNVAGSVTFTRDHDWHQNFFSYADSFSDSTNHNTFAYPTTLTDGDWNNSLVQYHFDFGAKTRTQGPPPSGQAQGLIQTITYDNAGRVDRVTTTNNGAYTRFWYGPNYIGSLATVNNVADEAYTNRVFDGTGRLTGVASNHPGSVGGYKAQLTQYDLMGRVMKQSNPAEINGSWVPAGDDAAGWVYTQQSYDWKGRPLRTTNPDTTYKEASYTGCGCAGGEVVTLTDEGTGVAPNILKRQQKLYSDVLGRPVKTEVLNWQGGSVYAATVNTYNVRDQVTQVRQWAGAEGIGAYQDTTMTYDGYSRLKTRHLPEQNAGTATTWDYNADDTIQKITDARGASQTFSYNGRHLLTGITYAAPAGITIPNPVSFAYDGAGNRTSMTDGTGSTSYNYDQLSRMTSETHTFNGLAGFYSIGHGYNLAGQVTSITDPANATINYGHDSVGRITSVTGSPYGTGGYGGIPYIEVSQYATNLNYRAAGQLKSLTYGNNLTLSVSYDSRLRAAQFEVAGRPPQFGPPTVMKAQYQYDVDGSLKYAHDLLDERFDRAFSYDHVAGLKEAYSGAEARDYINGTNSGTTTGPYRQSYQHDAFGNMTNRTNRFWSQSDTFTASYVNNRRQDPAFQYDADGNLTQDADLQYAYDAAGRNSSLFSAAANKTISVSYDGDGQVVGRTEIESGFTSVIRYVRSSVLGRVITELDAQGGKLKTNVYLGAQVLARQEYKWVVWQHVNPVTGSRGLSSRDGGYSGDIEPDPMGVNVGFDDPFINCCDPPPPSEQETPSLLSGFGIPDGRCTLDGMAIGCAEAMHLLEVGAAEFESMATVRITYTNGHVDTFVGRTTLPPGLDVRFTGQLAEAALLGFRVGNIWNGFDTGVHWALNNVAFVQANGGREGVAGQIYGGFGSFFAPQNSADADRIVRIADWAKQQVDKNYDDCLSKLGGSPAPGRNQAADILSVSSIEGIDATLLAVTWGSEASFIYDPVANFRPEDSGWDVGPGQISTTYYNNSRFTAGLPDAFGSGFSETVQFNGNSFQNLRATARAYTMDILSRSTSLGDAAGLFRAGRRRDRRGRIDSRYTTRVNQFNTLRGDFRRGGYDAFFHCLRNGP